MSHKTQKWITIYCGSSTGKDKKITEVAHEIGKQLALHNFGLVYGGASIGVMGAVSDGFLVNGAPVIGVIPTVLMTREVAHFHLTELIQVETMHERKAIMMQKADAFLALPGGYGTLEELFEVVTWAQLHIHSKPIFIFNQDGFYDDLVALMESMIAKGFVLEANRNLLHVFDDEQSLIQALVALPSTNQPISDFDIV